eukprot:comp10619_c0_seq1/m.5307 comp10619_c0_seq1/g.5307  ORF comp10619_c0_seq1/g.5307 comp10619_c0_seq1/m.5307 type:complete len:187 (-) comp10619_c0_seq1:615-1175(-)
MGLPPKQRKFAVLGFRGVGKSTITIQFVEGQFVETYNPTIENTFQKVITYKGHEYQCQIVDTAGQDETSIFPTNCSVGIDGYVLIYSITSKASLETVKVIHDKILDRLGTNTVPTVLVGNKTDLFNERRVSTEDGKAVAAEWQCPFIEVSAKSTTKAVEIFHLLIAETDKPLAGEAPPQQKDCIIL